MEVKDYHIPIDHLQVQRKSKCFLGIILFIFRSYFLHLVLTVEQAIPFIMGANIGTSVTNTIVAVTQAKDRNQFRRAFGGATVHDMFNWLSVAILLPLEVQFGILYKISEGFLGLFNVSPNDSADIDFLDAITKPITSHIVQVIMINMAIIHTRLFFKIIPCILPAG